MKKEKEVESLAGVEPASLDKIGAEALAIARELAVLQKRLAKLVNMIAGISESPSERMYGVLFTLYFDQAPGVYLMQSETTAWLDSRITRSERLLAACEKLGFIPGSYKCRFMRGFRLWLAARPGVKQVQYAVNDRRFLGITRRFLEPDKGVSDGELAALRELCDEILQGGADEKDSE